MTHEIVLPAGFLSDIAAATSVDRVAESAIEWLPRLIGASRAAISLLSDDGLVLETVTDFGTSFDSTAGPIRIPVTGSLIGKILALRRAARIDDLRREKGIDVGPLLDAGLCSGIGAPLISAGNMIGMVTVTHEAVGHFDDEDVKFVASIADLIAAFLNVQRKIDEEWTRARRDDLTGCLRRSAILAELDALTGCADPPAVLYLDIDGFKTVNDRFGHRAGDDLLRLIVERLHDELDDDVRLGRVGGDEFLIVVPADTGGTRARTVADGVRAALGPGFRLGDEVVEIGVSIGIAVPDGAGVAQMLHDADQAMYHAKNLGLGVVVSTPEIRDRSRILRSVDTEFEQARLSGAVTFEYQPIRRLPNGEILGAEALLRWNHDDHGPIAVDLLLQQLQRPGRVVEFTRWSVSQILAEWQHIRARLPWFHDKGVSLNLSPIQLAWPDLVGHLRSEAESNNLDPDQVVIEIVESATIPAGGAEERHIRELHTHGFKIALDDFGQGHNVLAYFQQFPIQAIKLDGTLVGALVTQDSARVIVEALATMADGLGLTSLAEGIENEAIAAAALAAGIRDGQGTWLGRPMPAEDFVAYAEAEGPPARDWASPR